MNATPSMATDIVTDNSGDGIVINETVVEYGVDMVDLAENLMPASTCVVKVEADGADSFLPVNMPAVESFFFFGFFVFAVLLEVFEVDPSAEPVVWIN